MSQRLFALLPLLFLVSLAGCSLAPTAISTPSQGAALQGHVHGGQQAVVGAHIYLFAAGTTANAGSGIAASSSTLSVSLLSAAATKNSDSLGAYVLTDSGGGFSITGDYTCTAGTQVYLYALGGNTGAGTNSAASFLSALGQCPSSGTFASQVPTIWMDEVSTVATAYALAGYATDATHISSDGGLAAPGTGFQTGDGLRPHNIPTNSTATQAIDGIANAFGNFAQLVDISNGAALATNPAGTATVPQSLLNTLADVLAACINASDAHPGNCTTLFTAAKSGGATGVTPTDTATAAINIAHNPASNLSTLLGLVSGTGAPYQPTLNLSSPPADLTLALHYTGGPLSSPTVVEDVAIDGVGNAWLGGNGGVMTIGPSGSFLSGASGYTTTGIPSPIYSVSIDTGGKAWVAGNGSSFFSVTSAGSFSSAFAIAGGGTHSYPIAVDGQNNVWVDNDNTGNLYKYDSSGNLLTPTGGTTLTAGALGLAADSGNRVWANLYFYGRTNLLSSSDAISGTYTGSGQGTNATIAMRPAIDSAGNYWVASLTGNLVEISSSGSILSGSSGYGLGSSYSLRSVAMDGSNNAWVTNGNSSSSLFEVNSDGGTRSPSGGFSPVAGCAAMGNAIDGSGNVWFACSVAGAGVYELIGAATPVVTPLSLAAKVSKIATRP